MTSTHLTHRVFAAALALAFVTSIWAPTLTAPSRTDSDAVASTSLLA